MSLCDSESGSDVEFNVLPYQFEPVVGDNDGSRGDSSDESSGSETEGNVNSIHLGNTDWCSCYECQQMPTDEESLCCQEVDAALEKMEDNEGGKGYVNCVTEMPAFSSICLDKDVLQTALVTYLHYEGPIDDEPLNNSYRFIAYRQWTAWIQGKLGKHCRKPIPSCVVKKIRSSFPSEDGMYKGFEYFRT